MINHVSKTPTNLSLHELCLCLQNTGENLCPQWGLLIASRSAYTRQNGRKSYEHEADHDFLKLSFFLSHSLKRSNQHLSGRRSNIFFKLNTNKLTILISVTNLGLHLVSLIRKEEAKVSKCEIGLTSWDTSASEIDSTESQRVGAEGSLDFMGCDSPRLKIFTDSHLDRPECLWQLLVFLEIDFAVFCAAEEWSLPMANLPDYTIASWPQNLTPLKPIAGNTCSKQYWLPFAQENFFQLQKKPQSSKCKMLEEFSSH